MDTTLTLFNQQTSASAALEIYAKSHYAIPEEGKGTCSVPVTLSVSQVSAYWRKIAITTPRSLWIDFFKLEVKKKATDANLAVLTSWLDRSSPLPIPISVTSSLSPKDLAPMMRILDCGSTRWNAMERFNTSRPVTRLSSRFQPFASGQAATGCEVDRTGFVPQCTSPSEGDRSMSRPWITSLDAANLTLSENSSHGCFRILHWHCQNLEVLDLQLEPAQESDVAPNFPTLSLRHATSVQIVDFSLRETPESPPIWDTAFTHLILPELRRLTVVTALGESDWPSTAIAQF
ncbi:hypothetical protein C8R47DRAFT_553358 [Mycena vitilis]|nr:hypothetical protein C8R47DRAFT_553358 [Mycena vitilis]